MSMMMMKECCLLIRDLILQYVVDDAKELLLVPVRDCCVVVCMSQLPLPPLSDHVPVVDVAAAVVFQLHVEGRAGWQ